MLDKTYSPADIEQPLYQAWEQSGAFKAGARPQADKADKADKADSYCIMIPPPNVTGSLHMGHALNNTLQDILVRYMRMQGKDVLWQPGMDHAGIATQMVVERQLAENNEPDRRTLGREEFVKRVWQWKERSGGTIINQLRRLGASCDWSRERFTMDEGLSKAVRKVFVELYREGLIYKDKRLVNWDPKLLTAISDLEVVQTETKGHLWHFKYPVAGEEGVFITVATTRPETMLGDSGVAVHPDDERYKHLIGKNVVLPLVGRLIPIIADDYADPEQGSGAVKITPAHDFNDFEVGKRHGLELINIFDSCACLAFQGNVAFLQDAPGSADIAEAMDGLDRFEARKRIVEMMEAKGLLAKIEDHSHTVPYGDRSGVPIEPWLTDQWYVDAVKLAGPAIKAVEQGDTVFTPKNWEKTYYEWMRNIQPWCISRQLWWGHQIPAWYGPDGEVFVAYDEAEAGQLAASHYGQETELSRDEDVLDTWFSSALWPFSTLGWPDQTPELKRYYKTDCLITGFDIIFFWVARMMMAGLHFMNEVPFHTVYIHALVRDEHGQKMSKSKGNVIDPIELVDEYGADALRFTLCAMAAMGRDIRLTTPRVEGYRNFGTKLWNAARFTQINKCVRIENFDPASARLSVNKWIAGELERTEVQISKALAAYRFNDAANAVYRFVWNIFCDWYMELTKPVLNGKDEAAKAETRAMVAWALDQILALLHPFMPFITEELWQRLAETGPAREASLIVSAWPKFQGLQSADADDEISWLIELISAVRSVRAEMNVPASAKIPLILKGASEQTAARVKLHDTTIRQMARLDSIETGEHIPEGAVQIVVGEATVLLPLAGVMDLEAEKSRLEKAVKDTKNEIAKFDARLANEKFLAKAPQAVIEEQRSRKAEAEARQSKLEQALARL